MTGKGEPEPRGERTFTYEVGSGESASTAVVRAVAAVNGHDPKGATDDDRRSPPPLYAAVDPDALDAVHQSFAAASGDAGRVRFRYHGYDVTVTSGSVRVRT